MSASIGTKRMAFTGVWPTLLVKRQLPGFEKQNAGLAAHIAEQEAREADFTARYLQQSFFASKDPSVQWLKEQIDLTVTGFLAHYGITRHLSWKMFGWYNVNRYGDHHAPHTHPWAYLSGTYYVQMPPASPDARGHSAEQACISFYDPRTAANMITADAADPGARAAHVVRPIPGSLLLWPAPLQHQVHPNLTQDIRISISFNVVMNDEAYVPGG